MERVAITGRCHGATTKSPCKRLNGGRLRRLLDNNVLRANRHVKYRRHTHRRRSYTSVHIHKLEDTTSWQPLARQHRRHRCANNFSSASDTDTPTIRRRAVCANYAFSARACARAVTPRPRRSVCRTTISTIFAAANSNNDGRGRNIREPTRKKHTRLLAEFVAWDREGPSPT